MKNPKKNAAVLTAAVTLAVALIGGASWHARHGTAASSLPRVYVSEGYGGYVVPARPAPPRGNVVGKPSAHPLLAADPVSPLQDAYNAGHYLQAEAAAQAVIQLASQSHNVKQHTQAVFARQIQAYSAARRHDLPLARVRFATMQTEAARLPDRGLEVAPPGEVAPTLEAEAAFQHAVCTNALGDKPGAEAEYVAFMKRYPDSPLVHAAVMRLQHIHGGDLTPAEEAARAQASHIAQQRQEAKMREASLCGPECLAEMLRRQGKKSDVHALADEMGTSSRGTSLAAMAAAADKHGFAARGLLLTSRGLEEQRLPVVALVTPGHYLIVEAVGPQSLTVWDPDGGGAGHGRRSRIPAKSWAVIWTGCALTLSGSAASL